MTRMHAPPTDTWVPDELIYAGREHLDETFVAGYDRKQQFDPTPDVDGLLARGVDERSTLIDLGSGTGTFTVAIAPHCGRVVAVDVSDAMIAHVRRRVDEHGVDNVECVHAGFLTYEHAGEPADVVYTRNALHQLPDFWKVLALTRIAAMLRPGGLLWLHDLVYSFEPVDAPTVFDAWCAGAVSDPTVGYTREDYEEHIRTEFSTFSWLLEPMLVRAGFRIVDTVADARSTFAHYVCERR